MDGNLPTNIPPSVEVKEISEKMSGMSVEVEDVLDAATSFAGGGGDHNGPIVLIVVGMAGSGKTTLTQRLTAECLRRNSPPYIVNLDPACNDPPYPVNIGRKKTSKKY
jgi:polynucleotide 5'-kinase involved in rRNA processing